MQSNEMILFQSYGDSKVPQGSILPDSTKHARCNVKRDLISRLGLITYQEHGQFYNLHLCKQSIHSINDYNLIKGYATLIYYKRNS